MNDLAQTCLMNYSFLKIFKNALESLFSEICEMEANQHDSL